MNILYVINEEEQNQLGVSVPARIYLLGFWFGKDAL